MKILYGVQGTGNGHITRARMMAKYFNAKKIDITWLFSGRQQDQYFEMDCFGDAEYRQGLTFATNSGRIQYGRTVLHNNLPRFLRDILSLDLNPYDVIVSDFEPVTAWAGKIRNRKVIGLGHQYAFGRNVPIAGDNIIATTVMKLFAPVTQGIGIHWHHFGHDNILPPIIDNHLPNNRSGNFYLVYLPFENQRTVTALLNQLDQHQFIQYSPELTDSVAGNVALRKTSHVGFKQDLSRCQGVISSAGFELISECLHMGIPLLVKPLQGQMEQISNAAALRQLKYANTMDDLDPNTIKNWLEGDKLFPSLQIPDVADAVVNWLLDGQSHELRELTASLWPDFPSNKSSLPSTLPF